MKKNIVTLMRKSLIFRYLIRKMYSIYRRLLYFRYSISKIDDKLVFFESYMGRSYACSPKAIYTEMLNNLKYNDYKFVWVYKNENNVYKNERTIWVRYRTRNYYKYISKAKYIISNSRLPEEVKKRKGQIYLQTWHGTPFKRIGYDIIDNTENALNTKKEMIKKYKVEEKKFDYILSSCSYATDIIKSAFNIKNDNKILEFGYPRNDILFTNFNIDVIKNRYNIPLDKKVILYVPTWRDNQYDSSIGYIYNPEINFGYLRENLEDYVILYRKHYFVNNKINFDEYKGFVYDVSHIEDINDLYLISDMMITDYSSCFFDFAILKKPIIFYMYDLDYYNNKLRGFYLDFNKLPGDIVSDEKGIINIVKDLESYKNKYIDYMNKFNSIYNINNDGNSNKRVINYLFSK